ncbi:ADM_collapsed_G0004150.mRNA.1.CDS.1 [Saccharomyces cerevisiae]|nr:ADM_collapsed_G0004150.mRNA.1.CDS.1 [Saccharomyces cerevisiae]
MSVDTMEKGAKTWRRTILYQANVKKINQLSAFHQNIPQSLIPQISETKEMENWCNMWSPWVSRFLNLESIEEFSVRSGRFITTPIDLVSV